MDYYAYQRQIEEYNEKRRRDLLKIGGIMLGHCGVINAAAVLIIMIYAVLQVLISGSFELQLESSDDLMIINMMANICGHGIFMGIIWLINRRKTEVPKKKGRMCIIFPICMLLVLQINLLVSSTDSIISELINFYPESSVNELMAGGSLWVMLITVGIIGPIVEEFAFRKVIFSMGRKYGFRFAAITSAAMFALMHQNITQFLFAFLIGLILAYAYEMSGKLVYPIILHMVNNTYAVIMSFIPMSPWIYIGINIMLLISFAVFGILFFVRKMSFAELFPARGDEGIAFREFFSRPTVIIYMVLCVQTAIVTMFM